jgi:predicted nuclease of predicted toxin-antitoxin system
VRLLLDECLSPRLAGELNASGRHLAVHPRDLGGLGQPDYRLLQRCLAEDPVLVTENAVDFRPLVAGAEIHPGLIILPNVGRAASGALLAAAIVYLEAMGDPMQVMVDHVLEVSPRAGRASMRCPGDACWWRALGLGALPVEEEGADGRGEPLRAGGADR